MIQACYDACQLRVVCSVFTFWFPDCWFPGFSGQCRFSLLIIWLHLTSAWMEYSFDALLNVHDSNSAVGPCVTWYAAIVAAWVAPVIEQYLSIHALVIFVHNFRIFGLYYAGSLVWVSAIVRCPTSSSIPAASWHNVSLALVVGDGRRVLFLLILFLFFLENWDVVIKAWGHVFSLNFIPTQDTKPSGFIIFCHLKNLYTYQDISNIT